MAAVSNTTELRGVFTNILTIGNQIHDLTYGNPHSIENPKAFCDASKEIIKRFLHQYAALANDTESMTRSLATLINNEGNLTIQRIESLKARLG